MKINFIQIAITAIVITAMVIAACTSRNSSSPAPSEVKTPDWAKSAVIYEVNIRQFSKEGTFNAFAKDLPRLKDLGVDILWIMPICPIGEKERKGTLGSYYAVKDYKAINPEFGTLTDFKALVNAAHALNMKLIIDWVPNHSSWDNALLLSHPEYYLKDSANKLVSPFDWTDVVRFDYANPEMRKWMVETMKYWLSETNIDGFRCDVAQMIPVDFWDSCRAELDKVKPIFFLAEADMPALHKKAFDMSYDWRFHHIMNGIARGRKNANDIENHFNWVDSVYPAGATLMEFTSNHDENSWNGTEFERLGNGAKTFAVLAATVPGMALIYNGQESAFNRRLKFFDKDSISWGNYDYTYFYKKLCAAKKDNEALWNGAAGGTFKRLPLTDAKNVFAFVRQKAGNEVVVLTNLTPKARTFAFTTNTAHGSYTNIFTDKEMGVSRFTKMTLSPWEYLVLVKK